MKTKIFLFTLLFGLIFFTCEDSLNTVGMGIQPDEDKIGVFDTIINIEARTVRMDSIYTKSHSGFLGNFYDPKYGDIKAGYLCQYYASFGFSDSIIGTRGNEIDSVRLQIYYSSYVGDSLAPMEVSVFPIIKPLEEDYYSNVDPAKYCDLSSPWAKKVYTARDLNVPDSINNLNNLSNYRKSVSITLPKYIGQDLYEKYIELGGTFGSIDNFNSIFPGTYLESSFGIGSILKVDLTEIYVFYTRDYTTASTETGADSLYVGIDAAVFTFTKEVTLLNNFSSNHDDNLYLEPSTDSLYLKSPVGICSEITIPIPDIVKSIGRKKFSSVNLRVNAYPKATENYTLPFPGTEVSGTSSAKLLLIEQDSVQSFFENQKIADSQTSYTTVMDTINNYYQFNNIANIVQTAIDNAPDKPLKLLLIPVQVEGYIQQSGYSSYLVDYSTGYCLNPSAVVLKKGGDNLQIKVIASDLEINGR